MRTQSKFLTSGVSTVHTFSRIWNGKLEYYSPTRPEPVYQNPLLYSHHSRSDIQKVKADAMGWRDPTNYTATFKTVQCIAGEVDVRRLSDPRVGCRASGQLLVPSGLAGSTSTYWGDAIPSVLDSPPSRPSWLEGTAINNMLADAKNAGENYALILAELRETTDFLAGIIDRLLRVIVALLRKDWKGAIRALGLQKQNFKFSKGTKNAAEAWLQLQFAIKPLMMDGEQLYDSWKTKVEAMPDHLTFTGFAGQKIKFSTKTNNHGFDFVTAREGKHFATCVGYYSLNKAELLFWVEKGFTNFFSLAWEILPFSFLIDYVIGIGTMLDGLDADIAFSWKVGYISKGTRYKMKTKLLPVAGGIYRTGVILDEPSCNQEYFSFTRTKQTTAPWPVLVVKNPWTTTRMSNVVALARAIIN